MVLLLLGGGAWVIFGVTVLDRHGRCYFPNDLTWTWVGYFSLSIAAFWCSVCLCVTPVFIEGEMEKHTHEHCSVTFASHHLPCFGPFPSILKPPPSYSIFTLLPFLNLSWSLGVQVSVAWIIQGNSYQRDDPVLSAASTQLCYSQHPV